MHRRHLRFVAALVAVTAACTSTSTEEPAVPASTAPAPSTAATAAPAPAPADPVDRLIVIDDTGNVVTMAPDGTDIVGVTDDAGDGTFYFQPQWSPDGGSVAWGEGRAGGFALVTTDAAGSSRTTIPTTALPFYLFWSPDSRRVAMLHNSPAGALDFGLVDVAAGTADVVAGGAPFYFSWSPDASSVAAHIGATGFSVLDTAGGRTSLGSTAEGYQAPQWTPAGILHLDGATVTLREVAGASAALATVPGPVTFVASPDGSRIAIQSIVVDPAGVSVRVQTIPGVPPGVVAVLDVASAEIDVIASEPALGFFWSPDGTSLLVLVPTEAGDRLEWLVWDGRATTSLGSFVPGVAFLRDVLPFFTQYAQSLRLWSPGSDSFAFVGEIDGERGVWVQRVDGSPPRKVADGSWVAWSGV